MESRAFHICPFCQTQCPVTASRCVRCNRALSGLPLPVYGTELDAEMRPGVPGDLVDLPLRETSAEPPRPVVEREAVPAEGAPATPSATRRPLQRSRDRRTARLAIAAGLMGAAGLLGAAVLVGTWLVRAQDREPPPPAEVVAATAPPDTTVPPATTPAVTGPPVTAPLVTAPRALASAPPRARPAPPAAAEERPAAPPLREASREDTTAPRPRRPPAAEVIAVHPDVAAAPVDVDRARDDFGRDDSPGLDAGARATLRARLDRAEQRRDVAAERVRELRAQVNVPVVRDVREYQRLQGELSAALDDLDQASVEVRRFRRALRRRDE
jgi:hypothetical protein